MKLVGAVPWLQQRLQMLPDGGQKLMGVRDRFILQSGQSRQIARHDAVFDRLDGCLLQLCGKFRERRISVQLAPFAQCTGPGEQGGNGIGRGALSLEMLVVMPCHRAVCRFIFIYASGGNQHR